MANPLLRIAADMARKELKRRASNSVQNVDAEEIKAAGLAAGQKIGALLRDVHSSVKNGSSIGEAARKHNLEGQLKDIAVGFGLSTGAGAKTKSGKGVKKEPSPEIQASAADKQSAALAIAGLALLFSLIALRAAKSKKQQD